MAVPDIGCGFFSLYILSIMIAPTATSSIRALIREISIVAFLYPYVNCGVDAALVSVRKLWGGCSFAHSERYKHKY